MPLSLGQLRSELDPTRTVLLLGAGAAVPSGAPTGAELAEILWRQVAKSTPQSDDLVDTASILERRHDRRAVIECIVSTLKPLRPAGGLLALPRFGWSAVFSTNFDRLVEGAFRASSVPLTVFRSNFDFSTKDATGTTRLYKIHGCITQDRSLGHQSSMILTESDYDSHKIYKQALFSTLQASLQTQNVLIVGQSLRDRHLSDLIKEVLALRVEGLPGKVYVLVYNKDDLRAPLWEDRGARIAFGGIDDFMSEMAANYSRPPDNPPSTDGASLPVELLPVTLDLRSQRALSANTKRMFNGGAATYADIEAGVTFERSYLLQAVEGLTRSDGHKAVAIVGAAGVGKTTFARQLLMQLHAQGIEAWEHRPDFPLQFRHWLEVEAILREKGRRGVLLVDECTHYLRAVNQLLDALASIENAALQIVVTANAAQWTPRIKSPAFYTAGTTFTLTRLVESEIHSLINLAERNANVASLVHSGFRRLRRDEQFTTLQRKASADMFVCLKNIFATESLDIILLKEYEDLDADLQEYYRYVAALEAVGARVHRQLIIRMLDLPTDKVASVLERLDGIVGEYDISERDGIYGWQTRHLVIARKITEYKFAGVEDLVRLFEDIIRHINPANSIELNSVRDLCDVDYGIGRLADPRIRQRLYRELIKIAPGERIPRHRLIRELLQEGELDDVEHELRLAEDTVRADAPIDRYRVRLLTARAKHTKGISDTDRLALLKRAYEYALSNTERHRFDKMSYYTLCEVAFELVERGQSDYLIDESLDRLRTAADFIHDPEILERARIYERRRLTYR